MKKSICISILLVLLFINSKAQQFARGADVGWLSEMEDYGRTFNNDNGQQEDLLDIFKDHCINSIRLRVWVNPTNTGGYSDKEDVLQLAQRAWNKGFRIMIDFHYSDDWADPGKQYKPAAWENYTVPQLTQAIYDHTYDVLDGLRVLGITPEWVQIGNETNDGMLWDEGRASQHMDNYAAFVTSGNNAAKAVFPDIITVVHVSNGWDRTRFQWNINGLVNNGARFDAIGMSLYPEPGEWQTMNSQCLTNMQELVALHNKPIVISEVGMSWSYEAEAKAFVEDIIDKNMSLGNKGLGVFWWEPQCYNWRGYDKGAWNPNTRQPTIALDAFMHNCSTTDCNGDENGLAYIDGCGTCVGGNTGIEPCIVDCNGDENGTAFEDGCGMCVGGNTGLTPCVALEVTFMVDMTGVDVSNGVYITGDMTTTGPNWNIIQMTSDGDNIYTATFIINSNEEGGYYFLNGNNWTARETVPSECVGAYESDRGYLISAENTTFANVWGSCETLSTDCHGTPNGRAFEDRCGICVGGNTGLEPCLHGIDLTAGWNLISYPFEPPANIETALESIWQYVEVVKDFEGFFAKSNSAHLNSLSALEIGKGYFVYVNENCHIQWP